MSKSDEKQLAALIKKNKAKAERAKQGGGKQFDKTLRERSDDEEERERFFSEMQKRDF